jgi:hypothetical protein
MRKELFLQEFTIKRNKEIKPAHNFTLLQWRVVDVAAQCSLITIARRTRQTSSDKSATASNAGRWAQAQLNQ